ncbi:hypothetical protein R1sor_008152 [Riccia sorocarpa]|uniref:DDE-1 domain-containing protein n=1 Tax=Riccia sorocarpa TaxID=122646 RepID=A0ABD3HU78_9MARC
MHKAAESEIEEIKKRAFEEADSIRESTRGDVTRACGASTMTSSHDAQTNSTVVGKNDADEASSILRFAQAFATEVRDEATRVLANARAEAEQLLSNARQSTAAVPSSGSATIADKEKMRREREASRKRRKYWGTRSWPDDSTEVQESAVVKRDKGDRHILHRGKEFCAFLERTHPYVLLLYVPAGYTSVYQPADVAIQRPLKARFARNYHEWAIGQVKLSLDAGVEPPGTKFDVSISTLRAKAFEWMWKAHVHVADNPDLIRNGWSECGLLDAWNFDVQKEALLANYDGKLFKENR